MSVYRILKRIGAQPTRKEGESDILKRIDERTGSKSGSLCWLEESESECCTAELIESPPIRPVS